MAAVERKSVEDLVGSVTNGKLRFALTELSELPRAAVVVEDRYSQIFSLTHVRPAQVTDQLAELQVRFPTVPILSCETRPLAEEFTYRYLAAALAWLGDEEAASARVRAAEDVAPPERPPPPGPSTRAVRRWALEHGLPVSDRGRLRPEIVEAWREAHPLTE